MVDVGGGMEVGKGHITIEVDLDEAAANRAAARAGDNAGSSFGDNYLSSIQKNLGLAEGKFNKHNSDVLSDFQKTQDKKDKAFEDSGNRQMSLLRKIINDSAGIDGQRADSAAQTQQSIDNIHRQGNQNYFDGLQRELAANDRTGFERANSDNAHQRQIDLGREQSTQNFFSGLAREQQQNAQSAMGRHQSNQFWQDQTNACYERGREKHFQTLNKQVNTNEHAAFLMWFKSCAWQKQTDGCYERGAQHLFGVLNKEVNASSQADRARFESSKSTSDRINATRDAAFRNFLAADRVNLDSTDRIHQEHDKDRFNRQQVEAKANYPLLGMLVGQMFSKGLESAGNTIGDVFKGLAELGTGTFEHVASHGLRGIFQGFSALIASALDATGPVGQAIVGGLLIIGAGLIATLGSLLLIWISALVGIAIVAFMAAVSFLAAALVGAGFLGIVGGAIVAGLMMLKDDPRIQGALAGLKDVFTNRILNSEGVAQFKTAVIGALGQITTALAAWAPMISRIFSGISTFLPVLTQGLIQFIGPLLSAVDRLVNSPFMNILVTVFAQGMARLGQAFGAFIDKFLNNAGAMAGVTQAIGDSFTFLAWVINGLGDGLAKLAELWSRLRANQDVMQLLTMMGNALGQIGNKLIEMVDKITKNHNAMEGFKTVLNLTIKAVLWLLDAITWIVTKAGEVVNWFTKMWESSNTFRLAIMALAIVLLAPIAALLLIIAVIAIVIAVVTLFVAAVVFGVLWLAQNWRTVWDAIANFFIGIWNAIVSFAVGVWNSITGFFMSVWGGVSSFFIGIWNSVSSFFIGIWTNIVGFFTMIVTWFITIWNTTWNAVLMVWNIIWGAIMTVFSVIWNAIVTVVQIAIAIVAGIIGLAIIGIQAVWNFIWGTIGGFLKGVWDGIVNAVTTAINWVKDVISNVLGFIRDTWNTVWGAIKEFLGGVWNWIWDKIVTVCVWLHDHIFAFLNDLKAFWSNIWNNIKEALGAIWDWIWDKIVTVCVWLHDHIMAFLNDLKAFWTNIWNNIKDFFTGIWDGIWGKIQEITAWIGSHITLFLNNLEAGWKMIWTNVANFFIDIWNNIKSSAVAGINGIIDLLNKGIEKINSILDKLHVGFKIETIGKIDPPTPTPHIALAGGGRAPNFGTEKSDSIHAMLSRNEYVLNARSARGIGYGNLDYMNRHGSLPGYANGGKLPGFAGGGKIVWVGANGDNEGLMEQHMNHLHVAMDIGSAAIVELARSSGIPFEVGSMDRPGSTGSNGGADWHSAGKAVDFMGYNQDALAQFFAGQGGLLELIHRSASGDYGVFGGGGGGGPGGIGGLLSKLNEFLAKGIDWIMDQMLNPAINEAKDMLPANTLFGEIGKGVFEKLREELKKKIMDFISRAKSSGGASGPLDTSPGSPAEQALKQALLMGADRKMLLSLFETGIVESRWQNSSVATDHDSVGVLQQRPSQGWGSVDELMSVQFQVRNFLSRWTDSGSPGQSAQNVQRSGFPDRYDAAEGEATAMLHALGAPGFFGGGRVGIFDQGGLWPSGTFGMNLSGKTERVLDPKETAAFDKMLADGGVGAGGLHQHYVYVDGVQVAHEAVVKRNNEDIVSAFKRGRSRG